MSPETAAPILTAINALIALVSALAVLICRNYLDMAQSLHNSSSEMLDELINVTKISGTEKLEANHD